MKNLHLILQSKGGVGKSVTARLLAEYLRDSGRNLICLDADGNNRSFAAVKGLEAEAIDLEDPENPNEINTRAFDDIIEAHIEGDCDTLIDVGAGTYRPMVGYAADNGAFDAAEEEGTVYIHTIVTGGEARRDTLMTLDTLCGRFGDSARVVVWLNNYWGSVIKEGEGDFLDWKVVQKHQGVIHGVVIFPTMKRDTFLTDFRQMMGDNLTFAEALGPDKRGRYGRMPTSRLSRLRRLFWDQLNDLFPPKAPASQPPLRAVS